MAPDSQQDAEKAHQPILFIWSVPSVWSVSFNWFVWFVLFIWLNQTNRIIQMNQINKSNQINQTDRASPATCRPSKFSCAEMVFRSPLVVRDPFLTVRLVQMIEDIVGFRQHYVPILEDRNIVLA